ncbi:hypothetical protein PJV92_12185 [Aliarcobacter butzleri]|uniref:Uncharacterized protein n=1 Tax=Aliarcobacter butzleri TaxID=28197 RepID=A0AAP4V0D4_9BACT|nr:hypothetical protein [Aliarcobacter butzleri]MDN5133477.1 hypothetical protein [Aliarcobacter butzleri]
MLKVIVFSNYNDHFLKVYNRHLFIYELISSDDAFDDMVCSYLLLILFIKLSLLLSPC